MTAAVPILTGITGNWTRVRPSFFRGLAKHLEYAEDKIFGLILCSTIGHGKAWGKLSQDTFGKIGGITKRCCELAINKMLGRNENKTSGQKDELGLIRRRKATVGTGYEYSIVARPEGDETAVVKCRSCGAVDEADLDLDFIPVPHSFFLSLPASCDHGMYLVVKCVVERTMRWDKAAKQIVVIPCEISIEEFKRATGKKRSEILQDLAKVQAEGYGFIGSEKVGRSNRYWARPENFASGPKRAPRKVKQPLEKRSKSETEKPEKVAQVHQEKQTIRPVEFVTLPCGVCRHCQAYGPMDLVPVAERKPLERTRAARAGPTGEIFSSVPTVNLDHWKKKA